VEPASGKDLAPDQDSALAAAAEIERLKGELARYCAALESIRDQTFEQATSQRLIDQLWHFVRWSKAVAREALESSGTGQSNGPGDKET